jgi:hypothetical protein
MIAPRSYASSASRVPKQTPERTAFVQRHKVLITHGLDRLLFERVAGLLKVNVITVMTGRLIAATIIADTARASPLFERSVQTNPFTKINEAVADMEAGRAVTPVLTF